MKSKGAIINDLLVANYSNGNGWINIEQMPVLAILNEAKLGNILRKQITVEQTKRSIPKAIELIEKEGQFTVAKKMKGSKIFSYRIAEKVDARHITRTIMTSRKQIRGRLVNSNRTSGIAKAKLGIEDNQLSLFREIEGNVKYLENE